MLYSTITYRGRDQIRKIHISGSSRCSTNDEHMLCEVVYGRFKRTDIVLCHREAMRLGRYKKSTRKIRGNRA